MRMQLRRVVLALVLAAIGAGAVLGVSSSSSTGSAKRPTLFDGRVISGVTEILPGTEVMVLEVQSKWAFVLTDLWRVGESGFPGVIDEDENGVRVVVEKPVCTDPFNTGYLQWSKISGYRVAPRHKIFLFVETGNGCSGDNLYAWSGQLQGL